jgi:hypothetical protein
VSDRYFAGTKSEYIAAHEKEFAWPAILLVLSREPKLPDTVSVVELRKRVADATGYPFSEMAIRLALIEPSFEIADPVSEHPREKYYRVRQSDVREYIRIHSSKPENRLSRLQRLPHDTFRAEVDKARKDAASRFERQKEVGGVFPPFQNFSHYSFEHLKSELSNPKLRLRPPRAADPFDWQKFGVIVAVVIGIVAILATLYAGNKL